MTNLNYLKETLLTLGVYYPIRNYVFKFRYPEQAHLDRNQLLFYSKCISADDTVFDVGANVGQRSHLFSQICRRVVAVEPQPKCARRLVSRFRFNKKVHIENVALGEKEGEAQIYICESCDVLSSMSSKFINSGRHRGNKWEQCTTEVTTLDQLIARYGEPKFIKIDVEGFELNVLRGLSTPVPHISIEFHSEFIDETKQCIERLNEISQDYVYNFCEGEDLNYALPDHADYRAFTEDILPKLGQRKHGKGWGDVYAIMKPRD